jgi:hypothetical protein
VTRKLWLLNLALVVLLSLLALQLRREFAAEDAREQALWHAHIIPVKATPLAPLPKVPPLSAIAYSPVAQMNLFSKDRNPNVLVDPVIAPAPPPVPPFPVARGVMIWDGMPPTVVLSDKPGGPQKGYHPGDRIGEWKIVSVDNQYIVLAWSGQEFKKRLDELMDKAPLLAADTPAPVQNAPAPKANQTLSDVSRPSGPGIDVGGSIRACAPGDNSAPGTVVDGVKKIVSATPFGPACRWEPVK